MSREYYIYYYLLDKKDAYLIWFSNKQDGFVTDENGFVPGFQSVRHLQNYASEKQIQVEIEETRLINLDIVKSWLSGSGIDKIEDYNPFLDAWNLFSDFSNSTGADFDSDRKTTNKIYNKIFWGCNIPAMTPEGKSFEAVWTKKELAIIRNTFIQGFRIFREKVKSR